MSVTVEPFDIATASDDELAEHHALALEIARETEPEDPAMPFAAWVDDEREPLSWRRVLRWAARDGSRRLVGTSALTLEDLDTNRHQARMWVEVSGPARNAGVASRLLAPVTEAAAAGGRTLLNASATEDGAGDGFLARVGAEKRSVERKSRCRVGDVDHAMLEDWVARAPERASEYSLLFWENDAPGELVEPFAKLVEVMNTAPRDDLDMEDWTVTPERYREKVSRFVRHGYTGWTMVARHDPTGELAGFTELGFAPWLGHLSWQGNTGVQPAHRNRGLGRWLKAAMFLKMRAERPEIEAIDTWNADSNAPMLDINVAMGFRPVRNYGDWQILTDRLAKEVAARAS